MYGITYLEELRRSVVRFWSRGRQKYVLSIKNHQLAPSKIEWTMKKVNIEAPEVNLPFPSNTKKWVSFPPEAWETAISSMNGPGTSLFKDHNDVHGGKILAKL